MPRSQAFSLVELLIVVAIVAILSAIAIPTYNNYVIKARVVELLSVADSYKLKLVDNFFNSGATNQTIYNVGTDTIDYVSVNTVNGDPAKHVIQVVAKMRSPVLTGIGIEQPEDAHDALTIQLQGVEVGEMIAWSCHVAREYNKYVPKVCQNNNLESISVG